MTAKHAIIGLGGWLQAPAGRYLAAWEQARLDEAVADAFGFHALQLGLPEIDGLRANRMPHRWLAVAASQPGSSGPPPAPGVNRMQCEFDALPFPSASLDLVVMPHVLEAVDDPHQTLREVERVLVPEGRLVITGFNPASLWGLRQRGGQAWRRLGFARRTATFLPSSGEFIGYWRLRDWLSLLSFRVESAGFGVWRAPVQAQRWLDRTAWLDTVGERWWPVLGAAYALSAVKHVRGMRMVGLVKGAAPRTAAAPAVATRREPARAARESAPS